MTPALRDLFRATSTLRDAPGPNARAVLFQRHVKRATCPGALSREGDGAILLSTPTSTYVIGDGRVLLISRPSTIRRWARLIHESRKARTRKNSA